MIFHKNVPYLILYQWTNFQCHTFLPSQYIKQKVLISTVDDINFKNYLGSSPTAMAGRKMEIQKFEYLENEKSFLDEIKNIFHSF